MNCNDIEQNLFYLAETGRAPETEAFFEHINRCAACKKLWMAFGDDLAQLEQIKKTQPKPFLANRVWEQLQNEDAPSAAWKGWNKVVLLAAMITGLYIGLNIGNLHSSQALVAENDLTNELSYFDDFQQESIEYNLINEEE